MRTVRSIQVLPPLRARERRRQADGGAARHGHRREFGEFSGEVSIEAPPQGTAPFVAQRIAQEWCPAPLPGDAAKAAAAYRTSPARRRRRDLLPRA